jgi:hypothetical protein
MNIIDSILFEQRIFKKAGKNNLVVYDFDDTLVSSYAEVSVETETEKVSMNSATFAHFKPTSGITIDFSAFNNVVKPRKIKKNFDDLKNHAKNSDSKVVILTARPKGSASAVKKYLESEGISNVDVVALESSNPFDKASWIDKAIVDGGHSNVQFVDDSKSNTNAVSTLITKHSKVKFNVVNVPHPKEDDYDGQASSKIFDSDNPTTSKTKYEAKPEEQKLEEKKQELKDKIKTINPEQSELENKKRELKEKFLNPKQEERPKSDWWEKQTDDFKRLYCQEHPDSKLCRRGSVMDSNAEVKKQILERLKKTNNKKVIDYVKKPLMEKLDQASHAAGIWMEKLEHDFKTLKATGYFEGFSSKDFEELKKVLFGY